MGRERRKARDVGWISYMGKKSGCGSCEPHDRRKFTAEEPRAEGEELEEDLLSLTPSEERAWRMLRRMLNALRPEIRRDVL
jgi:hypothetical protein